MQADPTSRTEPRTGMTLAQAVERLRHMLAGQRFAAAQELCRTILDQVPDQPQVLRVLGIALHGQGRSEEALPVFARLSELLPEQADVWNDLANIQIETDRFDAAAASLRRSLEIDPRSVAGWNGLAVLGLRAGRLEEADAAVQRGLAQHPQDGLLLFHQGLVRQQQGRLREAVDSLERAIVAEPHDAQRRLSLAQVLLELQRFDQVFAVCRTLIELGHRSVAVYNKLGLASMRLSRFDDSEAAFRAGLAVDPSSRELHHNFARMLYLVGRHAESLWHAETVLRDEPALAPMREMVVSCQLALGDRAAAIAHLRQWQAADPHSARPGHLLAGLGEQATPERASDAYVRDVFDDFAASFDETLQALDYRAPQLLQRALEAVAQQLPAQPRLLDAGCGTGLCGAFLAGYRGHLVGIDLSQAMLDKAATRGAYDRLENDELTRFLRRSPAAFDAIVSADTLCYFGALDEVLRAARDALRGSGLLLFTLEASADEDRPFVLHAHGRYSHARGHLLRLLRATGFECLAIEEQTLRRQDGQPVRGWIVTAGRVDSGHRGPPSQPAP